MRLLPRLRAALTSPGRVTLSEACGQVCDTACRADAHRQRTGNQVQSSLPIRL